MEYTTLGKTGQTVSRIGLGTEYLINTPRANVVSVVKTALDAGVNYIDLFFAQPELRENIGIAIQGGRDKIKRPVLAYPEPENLRNIHSRPAEQIKN